MENRDFRHPQRKQLLSFVTETPLEGQTMKTVNILHYRFVKNTFGCLSQAPCCLRQCQVSAPGKIKAHRCIGSNSWRAKLCQGSEGNPPSDCFPSAPHLAAETCSDSLLTRSRKTNLRLFSLQCLPTQVAQTPTRQRDHIWNIPLQESA